MVSMVYCWECSKKIETFYSIFFTDKDGCNRYGAVCKKCYKKLKK